MKCKFSKIMLKSWEQNLILGLRMGKLSVRAIQVKKTSRLTTFQIAVFMRTNITMKQKKKMKRTMIKRRIPVILRIGNLNMIPSIASQSIIETVLIKQIMYLRLQRLLPLISISTMAVIIQLAVSSTPSIISKISNNGKIMLRDRASKT